VHSLVCNIQRISGTLHEYQYSFMIISCSVLLRTKNVSEKSCRENHSTHFMLITLFPKLCLLWDNVEKYCRAGQARVDNMAHARCILDN